MLDHYIQIINAALTAAERAGLEDTQSFGLDFAEQLAEIANQYTRGQLSAEIINQAEMEGVIY